MPPACAMRAFAVSRTMVKDEWVSFVCVAPPPSIVQTQFRARREFHAGEVVVALGRADAIGVAARVNLRDVERPVVGEAFQKRPFEVNAALQLVHAPPTQIATVKPSARTVRNGIGAAAE